MTGTHPAREMLNSHLTWGFPGRDREQYLDAYRDEVLAEHLPPWESSYDSATFTPRLLAYASDEVTAKGAAEAWLHSQIEDATGLTWLPDPQMAVGEWDQWFELVRDNPYGDGIVGTEIVVRHRVAATAAVEPDEWVRCSGLHCPNGECFAKAPERGWQAGHMGTWLCPRHRTSVQED